MFERIRPASTVDERLPAHAASRPVVRRRLLVGANDDPAEREADRVAAAVVRTLGRSPAASGPFGDGPTRIRRSSAAETIRRSVYLFNEDQSIYKDTAHDALELAFMEKLDEVSIFIDYSAVDKLRLSSAYRNIARFYGAAPPLKASPKASGKITKSKTPKKQAVKAASDDNTMAIRRDILLAVKKGTADGAALLKTLGTVYAYDREDAELDEADIDDHFRGLLIANAIQRGPSHLRTGGGSRLPAPDGHVYVTGAHGLTREQVLAMIGVDAADLGRYAKVNVHKVSPNVYAAVLNDTQGRNRFELTSNDRSSQALYVSDVTTARASNSRIQVGGRTWMGGDAAFLAIDPNSMEGQGIRGKYAGLGPATADSGWILGTHLVARDRGDGQAAAMDQWNALGAAAYANVFLGTHYDLAQNWEWLHVRGAQVGGTTNKQNLVAGLYVTNSAMIPYEAMIERWARVAPHSFEARFVATGINGAFCGQIQLWIRSNGHPELGNIGDSLLASFNPLTGNIVDKLGNEFIKRAIDQRVRG